jgi:magnesium transporter
LVDGRGSKPVIRIIEYDKDGVQDREIPDIRELADHLDNRKVTWINIDGLGDLEALKFLSERFNLHPLAIEDVLNTGQRPKIELTSDYVFICVQMVYQDKDGMLRSEQVSFFLGRNYLITVQEEGEYDVFDPVRERIRAGRGYIRKARADYLAYALLDSIIAARSRIWRTGCWKSHPAGWWSHCTISAASSPTCAASSGRCAMW